LRQLPTNQYHAALSAFGQIIREYQVDSPSISLSLAGLGRSRDGPKEKLQKSRTGLTGSFILGNFKAPGMRLIGRYHEFHLRPTAPRCYATIWSLAWPVT